jgi:hypothetical protein
MSLNTASGVLEALYTRLQQGDNQIWAGCMVISYLYLWQASVSSYAAHVVLLSSIAGLQLPTG